MVLHLGDPILDGLRDTRKYLHKRKPQMVLVDAPECFCAAESVVLFARG